MQAFKLRDLREISFDIWPSGAMICVSNFCICISLEFPYFKQCLLGFDLFQQILFTTSTFTTSAFKKPFTQKSEPQTFMDDSEFEKKNILPELYFKKIAMTNGEILAS